MSTEHAAILEDLFEAKLRIEFLEGARADDRLEAEAMRVAIAESEAENAALIKAFSHYHRSSEDDTCAECGLDLRNPVHIRFAPPEGMKNLHERMECFLVQFTGREHEKRYGPFESEACAWIYLFGRIPRKEEIDKHKKARWSVQPAVAAKTMGGMSDE